MVYDTIQELCQKKGIAVSKLEKEAGLGNGTIGGWKESSPTLKSLKAVAEVLKVDVKKLID
jgi:transcriptional regulator with XRE-family HTH domain